MNPRLQLGPGHTSKHGSTRPDKCRPDMLARVSTLGSLRWRPTRRPDTTVDPSVSGPMEPTCRADICRSVLTCVFSCVRRTRNCQPSSRTESRQRTSNRRENIYSLLFIRYSMAHIKMTAKVSRH